MSGVLICKWALSHNDDDEFYLSFNAIYSKIGRYASEEVVLNLLNTKCISAMLYGTDACSATLRRVPRNVAEQALA